MAKKKGGGGSSRTAALFRLRDAGWRCLSSSHHIHMVGLYSAVHPITRRAPVGIQFRYNHDDCNNRASSHHTPPPLPSRAVYYYCHPQGPHLGPLWPSDLCEMCVSFPPRCQGVLWVWEWERGVGGSHGSVGAPVHKHCGICPCYCRHATATVWPTSLHVGSEQQQQRQQQQQRPFIVAFFCVPLGGRGGLSA